MKHLLFISLLVSITPAAGWDDKEQAKGKETGHEVHSGYFEKNNSGLKGDVSFLTITDQKSFDKTFGAAATMKKQNFLPKDAFDSRMVVATIKRGTSIAEYKVDKVTIDEGAVYIQYESKSKDGGGTAKFASSLVVSLDKGKYTSVVFIENGKK